MVAATPCGLRKRSCLPPRRTKFLTDSATTPGTDARQRAQGRWQRAFTDIDAHRILQASDAAKGLLHPAAAKVIATLSSEWDGLARHRDLPQLPLDNNTAVIRSPVRVHAACVSRSHLAPRGQCLTGGLRMSGAGEGPRQAKDGSKESCETAGAVA